MRGETGRTVARGTKSALPGFPMDKDTEEMVFTEKMCFDLPRRTLPAMRKPALLGAQRIRFLLLAPPQVLAATFALAGFCRSSQRFYLGHSKMRQTAEFSKQSGESTRRKVAA